MNAKEFAKQLRNEAKQIRSIKDLLLERVRTKIELDLIQTFHKEQDPTGKSWKKRKHEYPWKINNHSGNLDFSRQVQVVVDSISISYDVDYAKWVNNVRELVPHKVPEKWIKLFETELDKLIKEIK